MDLVKGTHCSAQNTGSCPQRQHKTQREKPLIFGLSNLLNEVLNQRQRINWNYQRQLICKFQQSLFRRFHQPKRGKNRHNGWEQSQDGIICHFSSQTRQPLAGSTLQNFPENGRSEIFPEAEEASSQRSLLNLEVDKKD